MDNQHENAIGFRDLNDEELELIKQIRAKEAEVAALVRRTSRIVRGDGPPNEGTRQAAIAKSDFEVAFMRLTRAVTQPASPWL